MVNYRSVKISEETYEKLNRASGKLQSGSGKRVSIDEAIKSIIKKESASPLDFAGKWKGTDKELNSIKKDLKKAWSKWQLEQ